MSWKLMHNRGRWSVIAETTNGRTFVAGGEEHCRELLRIRQLLPVVGRVETLGGALLDPEGAVVDTWGVEVCVDGSRPPLFESLHHLGHDEWRDCTGCGRVVSEGQMVSSAGRCSTCTYADDPYPRSVTYDEGAGLPRPGKCQRCSKKKATRWLAVPRKWLCPDCAWMEKQTSAADRSLG